MKIKLESQKAPAAGLLIGAEVTETGNYYKFREIVFFFFFFMFTIKFLDSVLIEKGKLQGIALLSAILFIVSIVYYYAYTMINT